MKKVKSESISHSVMFLCYFMGNGLPGFSVHGILQEKYWSRYIPFSRGSSQPRDCTRVSYGAGRFFMVWATMETQWSQYCISNTQHYKWIVHWDWATRQIENTGESRETAHVLKKQCVQFNLFCKGEIWNWLKIAHTVWILTS